MTLGELKKLLAQYPDDLEVILPKYSDYLPLEAADVALRKAVDLGDWLMRPNPYMPQEKHENERTYLALGD